MEQAALSARLGAAAGPSPNLSPSPNPNPSPSPSPNPNPNSSPNPNPNPNQAQAALASSDRVTGGVAAVGGPAYCFDTRPVGEYQLPPRYKIGAGITPPVAVQHMRRSAGEMAYQEAAEHRLAQP